MYEFEGLRPKVDPGAWVAPNAVLVGNVEVGPCCYIGWSTVLRGDHGRIVVEEGTAVEEAVVVHTTRDGLCRLGANSTIGHGAILHGADVGEFAVIGMGATLADQCKVGNWTIIGEAGLVKSGQEVPPEVIAVGQPVVVIGEVTQSHRQRWIRGKSTYQDFTRRNPKGIKPVTPGQWQP